MKTTMKKTAAYLLALLLVLQMVPAFADTVYSGTYTQKNVTFRDALEIISALDVDILKVGMQNQLSVSDSYKDIQWESDHPEIATVSETGLVEAVGSGKVTITVTAEGKKYKDTISFKIIADTKAEEPKTEPEAKPEESGNGQEEEQVQDETIIIFIKGNKTKVEYNGKVQKNTYTVTTSNDALFDESKLTMTADHLAGEKNCGVWKDEMTEADFSYDGDAEIVVSNGWIQIKPAQIEIKADDVTVSEGETPVFTASVVSGLAEGDALDLSGLSFDTLEQNGEILIVPAIAASDIIGNYKVSKVISGKLTVNGAIAPTLENAAENKTEQHERSVTISSNWPAGKLGHVGDKITLTAHLTGFTEGSYRLQWQFSRNGTDWTDQPGAEGETFTYELNETTTFYTWRVVTYDLE